MCLALPPIRKMLIFITLICCTIGCKGKQESAITPTLNETKKDSIAHKLDSVTEPNLDEKVFKSFEGLADTTFVRLADFNDGFDYDMRYATTNNFLKEKVYDCAECYTRVVTAKALIEANAAFKKEGVKIKFYDCYRPNDVQYKMWKIVPNPQYVANPVKGSIHNRGGAVDITLVKLDGSPLDMGTDFDFFGKRAYHDNMDLPKEILENRKLLKRTMEKHGFWSTRTEWWHYNLGKASRYKVDNFTWDCPSEEEE